MVLRAHNSSKFLHIILILLVLEKFIYEFLSDAFRHIMQICSPIILQSNIVPKKKTAPCHATLSNVKISGLWFGINHKVKDTRQIQNCAWSVPKKMLYIFVGIHVVSNEHN